MKHPEGWGRGVAAGLLALALASAPLQARADTEDESSTQGWGNIFAYSLCAAGVAVGAVSGSINVMIGAMIYCRQLYREAV